MKKDDTTVFGNLSTASLAVRMPSLWPNPKNVFCGSLLLVVVEHMYTTAEFCRDLTAFNGDLHRSFEILYNFFSVCLLLK